MADTPATSPGTPPPPHPPEPHAPSIDPVAGILSYLVPGLGQISQGRVAKGLLFLVSLYGLFFYGMALGQWRNVYLPDANAHVQGGFSRLVNDLYTRPHFAGQFFIGVAAWPAVYHYYYSDRNAGGKWFGEFEKAPRLEEINSLQRDDNKRWDLGWVYTVIAGVLNILVIYDAVAGPAFREAKAAQPAPPKEPAVA